MIGYGVEEALPPPRCSSSSGKKHMLYYPPAGFTVLRGLHAHKKNLALPSLVVRSSSVKSSATDCALYPSPKSKIILLGSHSGEGCDLLPYHPPFYFSSLDSAFKLCLGLYDTALHLPYCLRAFLSRRMGMLPPLWTLPAYSLSAQAPR